MIASAPIRHYPTLDSTNVEAQRLCAAGERGPLWLLADEQTAGRGRLGRSWMSETGNCYSTLVLPLQAEVKSLPQIGFVVALAVFDVVRHFLPTADIHLKWPNDCLVDGAKIAGILCESLSQSPLAIAIGCGINVAHAPTGLAYPATSFADEGAKVTRDAVFGIYRPALAKWLLVWDQGSNFAAIREAWARHAVGFGEVISVTSGGATVSGPMLGLAEDGALLIELAGIPHGVYAGDVSIPALQNLRKKTR